MSEDNIHPVVRLLAKRMESHPEEFATGRWTMWVNYLTELATPEEKLLLRTARMNEIHEEVMEELLNGDERRAEAARYQEEQLKKYQAMNQQAAYQQAAQLYSQQTGYPYYNSTTTALPGTFHDTDYLGTSAISNSGLVASIKKGLGIK